MKRIIFILAAFMLSIFATAQPDQVSKKVNQSDSLNVTVRFEKMKLSKEDATAQELVSTLLNNSVKTNDQLSTSLNKLTSAVEKTIEMGQKSKIEIIAANLNTTKAAIEKSFKRNGNILLISLLPALIFVMWAMGSFLFQKGLDVKNLLTGTAVMALYALIGSAILYAILSLVFNQQYFVVKNLMSTLF
jgi:hypothetical protein